MAYEPDTWSLGDRTFTSRFILGSGKFNLDLVEAAVRDAGAEIVTLAVRRANTGQDGSILDAIPEGVTLLPNTSGARTADEAVRIARLARAMVAQLGMSDQFGMTALETVNNRYLSGDASLVCSNETATLIDKEVMAIIKNAHAEARKILEDNAQLLHEEAEYLLQKETITGEEFMEIFSRHQQLKALPQPSAE